MPLPRLRDDTASASMNRLDALQIFVRVAELSSFTRAAESLGLQKASTTTAVQKLERLLGTQLLNRTTRKVQMTQDGRAFYERCKDVLADVDELQSMFRQGAQSLRGRLRVDMPGPLGRNFIIPQLPQFLREHPHVEFELSSTDRKVDLVREGFDCVLRVGGIEDQSLIARPLGRLRMLNLASPAYVERFGVPRTLDDLAHHQLVHYVSTLGARSTGFEYFDGGAYRCTEMHGAITVNNADAYQAACLAGMGIVQAPALDAEPLLQRGLLVSVLEGFPAEPMPVSLLYAHRRNQPQRLKVFMAWLAEILTPHLESGLEHAS